MAFDPISWLLGHVLTRSVGTVVGWLRGPARSRAMETAIRSWEASLPPEQYVKADALFPSLESSGESTRPRPARDRLAATIGATRIPSQVEWHDALVEQWAIRKRELGEGAQPFFLLEESVARPALYDLARALTSVCEQDEALFRGTVNQTLNTIAARSAGPSPYPDPFSWCDGDGFKPLAGAIESALKTSVELICMRPSDFSLCIWMHVPKGTAGELRERLLTAACVASGVTIASYIEIGVLGDTMLSRTDGAGSIATLRVKFARATTLRLAETKTIEPTYWPTVHAFALKDDNFPTQRWDEIHLRDMAEYR